MSASVRFGAVVAAVICAISVAEAPGVRASSGVDALERSCAVAAGRYESGWSYDAQGVLWGRVSRCTTAEVSLSCEDSICHARRRIAGSRGVSLIKDKSYDDRGVRVAARRSEFDRVLHPVASN